VTARLTEVATGRVVSSEKLDGKLDEIFQMQDRLASSTAAVLDLTAPAAAPSRARSLDAYEAYARGSRFFHQLAKGTFEQARELFEEAIAAEPDHAPALAGLSAVHAMRFTFMTDPADLEKSINFARRSIAADGRLGEPHIWLGYSLWRQGKTEEALEEERKAMELDPGNPFGPYFAGWCRLSTGRAEEAVPLFARAVEADSQHGWSWLARWSLEQAVALEQKHVQSPTAGVAGYLGECLRRQGEPAAARTSCLEGLEAVDKSDHKYRDTFRAVCLCVLARAALDQEDLPAARAAFTQAIGHLRGRPRALGGGHLLVQALAGLSRAGEGAEHFEEALGLFEGRQGFDYSYLWICSEEETLSELSLAAAALGRPAESRSLAERSGRGGSSGPSG
jgi:tetratricopeptide (TPR) repeat protein